MHAQQAARDAEAQSLQLAAMLRQAMQQLGVDVTPLKSPTPAPGGWACVGVCAGGGGGGGVDGRCVGPGAARKCTLASRAMRVPSVMFIRQRCGVASVPAQARAASTT